MPIRPAQEQVRRRAVRRDWGEALLQDRLPALAADMLHACLLADAEQRIARSARRHWDGVQPGEVGEARDAETPERRDLPRRDPGDVTEMVVAATAPLAVRPPGAGVTVRHEFRIGVVRRRDKRAEAAFKETDVGRALVDPVAREREVRTGRHHVHPFRGKPLELAEEAGVHAELEQGRGPGVARELGVDDFVGPVAEVARRRHPAEEVGATGPDVILECRLVDDIGAGPHRGQGFVRPDAGGGVVRAGIAVASNRPAIVAQAVEPGALVTMAALAEFLHARIVARSSEVRCRQLRKLPRSVGARTSW